MSSNITFEITPIEEAISAIVDNVKEKFLRNLHAKFIDPQLESNIANFIDELKDGLYCIVEYPYVDKVYRDSYYNYYSSKHSSYQRDCIRISFFNGIVTRDDFLKDKNHKPLKDKFLGFSILRPTTNALFGRAILSPKAFKNNDYKICTFKQNALILGVKLDIEGFPHSSQDGETLKCAETTIWALMEYFGNKYADYKPTLPAGIIEALKRFSYQRQLPSNGLTMDQISFALKEFGFGTRIYSSDPYEDELDNIIDYYVESGIPVVIGLQSGEIGHVIIAVGKQYPKKINWATISEREELSINGITTKYIDATCLPAKYVVQDDNLDPYRLIDLGNPGEHYDDPECKKYKIDSVVVPLYPKIYLEAVVAKSLALYIIKDKDLGYNFGPDFVFRFFLTSSRSFKDHITFNSNMSELVKLNIITCRMPKFIWCAEIYSKKGYNDKKALGIILLDATEANSEGIDALLFAGYPDRCISMIDNDFVSLQQNFENYRYYANLK